MSVIRLFLAVQKKNSLEKLIKTRFLWFPNSDADLLITYLGCKLALSIAASMALSSSSVGAVATTTTVSIIAQKIVAFLMADFGRLGSFFQ